MSTETIFALASGSGRAAVAIVRISGDCADAILIQMAGALPPPRVASLVRLRDPASRQTLDRALAVWFPGPASFTGEDCAELHIHGGRAVVEAVLATLGRIDHCRLALPGEFTRRAFLNHKMDLAEVEGLADLIEAQTEAQRRQALRQLEGVLGTWVTAQRQALLMALAAAESAIDFSDEGDVAGDFAAEIRRIVADIERAVASELARSKAAARVRDGLVVALTGPPNAGKSTLLNALARRDAAIVSPHAGTTRDPVEVQLDLDGSLVLCIDTAGLRETDDPVEREGIARARARAQSADLVLWLFDAREPMSPPAALGPQAIWTVATKTDLLRGGTPQADFAVAPPTGEGLVELVSAIRLRVGQDRSGAEAGVVTRQRHRSALEHAQRGLRALLNNQSEGFEIVAEDLRSIVRSLDSLVGPIDSEEVLGEIFARFCIGK